MTTDDTRCVHGLTIDRSCGLCRIDRRDRIGERAAALVMVSGVCEPSLGDHERCRMIGCDCRCHRSEDFLDQLERSFFGRRGNTR